MKKLSILLMIPVLLLCGCGGEEPEETGALDYDMMDKEFGQLKEDKETQSADPSGNETGSTEAYKNELPAIKNRLEEYAKCLLENDARGYAKSYPDSYTIAIMNQQNCTWDEAVALAEGEVKKTFEGLDEDYSLLSSMKGDFGFSVSVKNITVFNGKDELIKAYEKLNINITDAIEVDFVISVSEENRNAYLRLVKLSNGSWAPDIGYFET